MHIDQVNTDKYTHIHFAFANITSTFDVDISNAQEQFDHFKAMTGSVKKIISFGGWDFSTKPGTFNILRQATKIENRATFEKNIITFLTQYNLDGVDIGWEYPGVSCAVSLRLRPETSLIRTGKAPDIPGIPEGDPEEGKDYYETLRNLKRTLGDSKSVSFAAPASYWYLKAFPMKELGTSIDYIIYITFNLHGQ